jgi:hypothetical protein
MEGMPAVCHREIRYIRPSGQPFGVGIVRAPRWVQLDRSTPGYVEQAGLSSLVCLHQDAGIDNGSDQVPKGRSVDALASRGYEGRGTLR